NDRASRRYVLFAALPREQILHGNNSDPAVLQFLHLRFKRGGRDLGARIADLIYQTMVTKNNRLSRLIDNRLRNLGRCRCYRSGGGGRWSGRRLRVLGNGFVVLTHRKIERQKQWN